LHEIIADTTDPGKAMTASASIARLEALENSKNLTTPHLGKHLTHIYRDAKKVLKDNRPGRRAHEQAKIVVKRRRRAGQWIETQINNGR
jgi:hypothetical protein